MMSDISDKIVDKIWNFAFKRYSATTMPHSHHSHSGQFCKHASGLLEGVVLEAIRQGFEVYGLTEHVPRYRLIDRYPEEVNGFVLVKRPKTHHPPITRKTHPLMTSTNSLTHSSRKHIASKLSMRHRSLC